MVTMELVARERGHAVYVRCPTFPPTFEAACECGFRSAPYFYEVDANLAGRLHAETAPEVKAKSAKPKAKPKPKPAPRTARKK